MNANRSMATAALAVAVLGLLLSTTGAMAGTPPKAAGRVYADDQLWATFATANLPPGPSVSFDTLYHFPGLPDLVPVANAGPTNPNYNGGRWMVENVAFTGMDPTQFTDQQQILDNASLGLLSISGPVQYFECPLLPL